MNKEMDILERFAREADELIARRDWREAEDQALAVRMVDQTLAELVAPPLAEGSVETSIGGGMVKFGLVVGGLALAVLAALPPGPHGDESGSPELMAETPPSPASAFPGPVLALQNPSASPPPTERPPAADPERKGPGRRPTASELFGAARVARGEMRWQDSERLYKKLIHHHGSSREAKRAHYNLGRLYLDHGGKSDDAIAEFRAYIRIAEHGPLLEDALYHLSVCHRKRGEQDLEQQALRELERRFPGSNSFSRTRAQIRLKELEG